MNNGAFIISLDFELFWGVFDKVDYDEHSDRIHSTRKVIPNLIEFFEENMISVTWSTVGLLMLNSSKEYSDMEHLFKQPSYTYREVNNYNNYKEISEKENFCDEVFFAKDLVNMLKETKFQKIGTHTFSHYYCLEKGQTIEEFSYDLVLAKKIASKNDISIKSIVFPRNQYDDQYLKEINSQKVNIYRGTPESYIYKSRNKSNNFIRALRLLDTYFNITGHITHEYIKTNDNLYNVKASRFLRPQNSTNIVLKKLQLRRIKNEMTNAAKKNHYYHLWWHPHNFAASPEENFSFIQELIVHFDYLNKKYNFQSESMESFIEKVK